MDVTRVAARIVAIGRWFQGLVRPARSVTELAIGAVMDRTRTRPELLIENAVLH